MGSSASLASGSESTANRNADADALAKRFRTTYQEAS